MRFLNNILAKAGLVVDGTTQLNTIANATVDTDRFLVSDGGVIKYRTGAELGSDIGAANLAASTLKHQVKLGEAINKGQAVYVSSADGTNMIVSKASNASEATSSKTLGLIETSGVLNDQVNVVTEGLLAGLDTSTAAAGDPVWLGTGGNLIFGLANKPYAPAHLVFIGIVTRVQQNNGEIFVKVQNGFELKEIHDVQITTTPSNNTVLAYESATSLYKMKSIATLLGYTPADDSLVVHLAGTETITGAKTFSSALTLSTVANATIDTDRFLVSDSGVVKYRTGAEVLSDIGAQPLLTNPVTGTGTTNYIPKFTSSSAIGNSVLYETGGNIGIGTITPSSSGSYRYLTITGGSVLNGGVVELQTSDNARNLQFYVNNVGGNINMTTNNPIVFYTNTSERMRLDASGNLGLGVTPTQQLTVGGRATIQLSLVASNNTGASEIYFGDSDAVFRGYIGYQHNGDYFQFSTAAAERMRINNVGNVGIGTSAPYGRLELYGSGQSWTTAPAIRMWDSFNNLGWLIGNVNNITAGDFYIRTLPSVNGAPGSTEQQFTIKYSTGNVGIGTTSPNALLQLSKDDLGRINITHTNTTSSRQSDILFTEGTTSQLQIGTILGNGIYSDQMWFRGIANLPMTFLTNDTERMRITSTGNVGIGTSSPSSKFTVTNGNVEIQSDGSSSMVNYLKIGTHTNGNWGSYIGTASNYNSNLNTDLRFGVSNAGTSTEAMRITSGGNVGIGTTSPNEIFETYGGNIGIRGVSADAGNSVIAGLYFRNQRSSSTTIKAGIVAFTDATVNTSKLYFQTDSAGSTATTKMAILGNGNVGIGTTAPSYKLEVTGNSYFDSNMLIGNGSELRMTVTGINIKAALVGGNWRDMVFTTASAEAMRITGNGEVCIGQTTAYGAGWLMNVNGNAYVAYDVYAGTGIQTGAPTGGTSKKWKLGRAGITLGGSNYSGVEVEIDGTLYYLVTGYLP